MMDNKRLTIIACGVFILIGFVVNGIVDFRNQNRSAENTHVFSESNRAVGKGIPYNIDYFEAILKKYNYIENNRAAAKAEAAVTKSEKNYIIKLINGKVVVYLEENTEIPIRITDIEEHTLRSYDREQLLSGISIKGERELNLALEDFGS